MKPDIEHIEDIRLLVKDFYEQVLADVLLAPFFSQIPAAKWEKHIELMCLFWHNAAFHSGRYTGNPMQTHTALHTHKPLSHEIFRRWYDLWAQTVDSLFEGQHADKIKQTAGSISQVMQLKILGHIEET